jgi:hypothetical protein
MLTSYTAPARAAIKYEQKVFSTFGEKTMYHGPPTNETDIHWEDLYQSACFFVIVLLIGN